MNFAAHSLGLLILLLAPAALADIEVLGLFKGAALLEVDGEQKLLRVGQTWKNVVLLEASSRRAVADIDGERVTLTVSARITSNYKVPETRQVQVQRNSRRQYVTNATINGYRTPVMVDTGANIVAMNSRVARAAGVDYEAGTPTRVGTASGVVSAWSVTLASIDVGGIRIDHVRATVLEGSHPETVLLGMSYLQHVELMESNGVLSLTARY
jgi:aspartyl protease family protein